MPRSSTAPSSVPTPGGHAFRARWKRSWYGSRENSGWGYDRIAGARSNLGHVISAQTVGNVLKRHGIAPAPKRSQTTSWKEFITAHMAVRTGADFFTLEALTWRGLATYYVLRALLPTFGRPACDRGRHHPASHQSLDDKHRPQCRGGERRPKSAKAASLKHPTGAQARLWRS